MIRALLLLLAFVAPPLMGAGEPELKLGRDGVLAIGLLRDHLENAKVKKQLMSGLTTSLVFQVEARRGGVPARRGGCRVDVRFEPWDQVFFVTLLQYDGAVLKLTLSSFDEMVQWFRDYNTRVLTLGGQPHRWKVEITMDVLPFSQREADKTSRWFAQTLSNPGSTEHRDSNRVLDLLASSSIKRKSITRFYWEQELRP